MQLNLFEHQGHTLAELIADEVVINSTQDALDLMANAQYQGAEAMILHQHTVTPSFFDLSSGVAGEILQKYSNYHMRLAIVGDIQQNASESLTAFIRESNRGSLIAFVQNREEALAKLIRSPQSQG